MRKPLLKRNRWYSRAELMELGSKSGVTYLGTCLRNRGYKVESNGRVGKNYMLRVVGLPTGPALFKEICCQQLGFNDKSSSFKELYEFFKLVDREGEDVIFKWEVRKVVDKMEVWIDVQTIGIWTRELRIWARLHSKEELMKIIKSLVKMLDGKEYSEEDWIKARMEEKKKQQKEEREELEEEEDRMRDKMRVKRRFYWMD